MQTNRLALAAIILLTGVALADRHLPACAEDGKASPPLGRQKVTSTTEPSLLACNMTAMTPVQRQRHDKIGKQLRKAVKEVKELPDGYAFRYAADPALFLAAAEFVTLESRCCSFYNFGLDMAHSGGPMWLRVTGSKEAKPIIKAFLAP
jgi:hypothetical protein